MTDPALDSLRLGYERTTLAWMRTSLSLIGFGFTIDKFFQAVPDRTRAPFPQTPHAIGLTMIGFGLLSLLLPLYEVRRFRKSYPDAPRSMAGFVAAMIAIIGIMALLAAIAG